ncbi:MAG: PfkB family carbohydrate kinase, partial [Candidatus Nucleicultricaceae bacterium]
EAPTGSAFICVDGAGENFITVSQGANHHLKAELVRHEDLRRADIVLLQMEVDEAENLALSKRAKAFGKQVILNYAPASDIKKDLLTQCDILVVNQHELRLVAATYGLVEESLHTLSKELSAALSLTMITTLGGDGVIVSQGAEIKTLPAFQIHPIDTTGAGDAFVGCFAGFLSEGDALIEAVEKAMIAAGLSCTKRGTQESYCYLDELQRHRRII